MLVVASVKTRPTHVLSGQQGAWLLLNFCQLSENAAAGAGSEHEGRVTRQTLPVIPLTRGHGTVVSTSVTQPSGLDLDRSHECT